MSEYRKSTTNCKDRDCLIDALVEKGFAREHIEIHEVPQQLIDFQGRPTRYLDKNGDKANVIVRRKYVGGSANDLGFVLNPKTGTYDAIISDFDTGKYNAKWLTGLKVSYVESSAIKLGKLQGFQYLGKKEVDGKFQHQWLDPRTVTA